MKFFKVIEQMKTKNFYIILVFIAATSFSVLLLRYPSSSLRDMVNETHKQISNIKYLPSKVDDVRELTIDPRFLHRLGFNSVSTYYHDNYKDKLPVIGTAIEPGKWEDLLQLMKSVQQFFPGTSMVVYDLGISKSENILLKKHCNDTWHCSSRLLKFDKLPSHVHYLLIKSYVPVCIQKLLFDFGSVIWADTSRYFISSNISQSLEQAKTVGLVAWSNREPTSSLTHPKMFEYFNREPEDFYFHPAVDASRLIIYNTKRIHQELMLPWVKCALVEECMSPIGAQNVACNLKRKPRFKYSACHHYDKSALNVILGVMFEMDNKVYTSDDEIFGILNKYKNNDTAPSLMSRYLHDTR